MSVEKFKASVRKENEYFTTVLNNTINEIKNVTALSIYIWLMSKPSDWEVNIKAICNHFGIGKNKAYGAIKYLIDIGVVERIVHREDGKIQRFEYVLKLSTSQSQPASSPFPQKQELEKQELENEDTYKRKKETKEGNNKTPYSPPTENLPQEPEPAPQVSRSSKADRVREEGFDEFYAAYPRKVKKPSALKAWKKNNCHKIRTEVMEGLAKHKETDSWKDVSRKQYIPHPSTWLNAHQWADEVENFPSAKSTSWSDHPAIKAFFADEPIV